MILSTILSGCGHGRIAGGFEDKILSRKLPDPPAWAKPVPVTELKAGMSSKVALNRRSGDLKQANTVIVNFKGWYVEKVQKPIARGMW